MSPSEKHEAPQNAPDALVQTPYLHTPQNNEPAVRRDDVVKHLELIQGVINRMAGNSFLLKGWVITLVAALFSLACDDSDVRFGWIALLTTLVFWFLDAYFLWQERRFRKLYEHVGLCTETELKKLTPFCMDADKARDIEKAGDWIPTLTRPTLLVFYLSLLATVAGGIWYLTQSQS